MRRLMQTAAAASACQAVDVGGQSICLPQGSLMSGAGDVGIVSTLLPKIGTFKNTCPIVELASGEASPYASFPNAS
jgi:hypothetical protein